MSKLANKLFSKFGEKEYAHSYMEGHCVTRIAAQIHAMRKSRDWSQEELAEKAGISQERVSKIESSDFDSVTLKTLRKFGRAFDVHLHVAFMSFSDGILDVANIDPNKLSPPERSKDLADQTAENLKIIEGAFGVRIIKASSSPILTLNLNTQTLSSLEQEFEEA